MLRSPLKLSGEGSLFSGSRRVLDVDIAPARADEAVAALRHLVGQIPAHPGILPLLDAGVVDGRPYLVTPPAPGDPLDAALAAYGPAAFADAMPRLALLADALDAAAAHGVSHGALEPRHVLVSTDDTRVVDLGVADALRQMGVTLPWASPYAAPEQQEVEAITPAADQYALAAIAYEWLLGRPTSLPADMRLEFSALRDIDHEGVALAFATAMAPHPAHRFASCSAFVRALQAAMANDDVPRAVAPRFLDASEPLSADLPIRHEPVEPLLMVTPAPERPERFGLAALTFALIAGITIGALAMVTLTQPATRLVTETGTGQPPAPATTSDAPPDTVVDTPLDAPRDDLFAPPLPPAAQPTPPEAEVARTSATVVPVRTGTLVVDSRPAGAAVVLDGRRAGVTPLLLSQVTAGTHTVRLERPGYRSVTTRVDVKAGERARVAARLEGGQDEE